MRLILQKIAAAVCLTLAWPALAQTNWPLDAGPLFAKFPLTLTPGDRFEAAGPLYYSQESGSQKQWAWPPFYCFTRTPDVDWAESEFLYPMVSYRRFGGEYRLQLFEFFSFSGGQASPDNGVKQFTLFPFYFQQRAPDTNLNYTALVPFYGHLENRLFRDDIKFVLFPAYSETRKKDVVTDNYLYPFFDVRHGDHMSGWQFWPVVGVEHKDPTLKTNSLDEVETVGGYDKFFAAFPFYFKNRSGLGTTNVQTGLTLLPFFNHDKSATREVTSYGWPLGYNVIHDKEKGFDEHDFIWPLFVKARGGKNVTRVFPFYSKASDANLESIFWLWPLYKFNRLESAPLERRRTRILFFLYSDTTETNTESGEWLHRADFWPFYTYRRDSNGDQRWQAFSVLEPFFPNNRSITREYSQVWSVWRAEKNHKNGHTSQSLLWNLYRRDTTPDSKNFSLFFGLIQYQTGVDGRRWRICYMNSGKKAKRAAAPSS